MRKLYIYELADKLRRTNGGGRTFLVLLFMLLVGSMGAWATGTNYYAKLTAETSATGEGLVYAATANTAPTADSQYKTSMTVNKGKQTTQSFTYYVWAKSARGYTFSGWTGSSATVGNNPTGSGDAIAVSGNSEQSKITDGKVTANWSNATAYTITYKQPENNGQYSVRYDYTTIANNALTSGSETYTMTTATADEEVTSYAADQVTLSTSLSSFIAWVDGGGTELSTDKEYTFNPSKPMTITATFTPPKEYQASVTSNGETTQYKTIQEAIAAANKLSTMPTVTLLDNITGVDEILTITKSMTLDLAGYTLSGAGGERDPNHNKGDISRTLFAINTKGITVTIKDSSTAKTGTISCTDELNHDLYTIRMDQGTLNLESGTIHCENPMKYVSGKARMRCYTIYGAPATTINLTGATIEAVADYYAYGILTGGWYAGNGPAKVNISGGTVKASAYNSPNGVTIGYGTLNVTGGLIEADGTGGTWSSYGITVNAGANAQKKNEWKGTLTMSGGTVKATSTTSGARGIRVNRSVAFVNNTQEVGSIVNGEATITGGTITAETTTNWPVAVEPYGDCTISGGTITANATTTDAYGVRVVDGTTYIRDGANITATAKTGTAIGVASIADTDGSKGTAYEGDLHVKGGTITAKVTSGSNARGIAVYTGGKRTITNTSAGYYPGVYFAAGKATISGGKVSATASGSGANAVYVGATETLTNATYGTASATPTCSITGGMFIASGTNAASVNSNAGSQDFTITSGYYQQSTNLATYVPSDTKTVYDLTSAINSTAYNFGCRYYVSDWDNTKSIAKNTSTSTTYTSLSQALSEATSGQTVVLTDNYRMSDAATVKNGVTLFIPYNTSNTPQTTKPNVTSTWTVVSAYKTLYMGSGASITVENGGAVSVGGSQFQVTNRMNTNTGGPGSPVGPCGVINMKSGGTLTLENGSTLYAWGYITGQNKDEGNNTTDVGSVIAKNGSNIYESFVIGDYQGGNATSAMGGDGNKTYKVFPFNQYFFPNIEVPTTFEYGSTDNAYLNLSNQSGGLTTATSVKIIASSDCLFDMGEDCSVKRYYDAQTDHQRYETWGDFTIGAITITMGSNNFASSGFVLPLTGSMAFHIHSGTLTVPYDVSLLPGSEITIDDGVEAKTSGNVYVWDADNWDKYGYGYNRIYFPFRLTSHYSQKWDSKDGLDDAKLEVDGTLTVAGSGKLYTTEAGADICSNGNGKIRLESVPTATSAIYQVTNNGQDATDYKMGTGAMNGKSYYATKVDVTAAQLHNGDGSYVKTAGASAGDTYYYNVDTEKWQTAEPVLHPTFSLADGVTYDEEQTLELVNRTDGATIKYSTDGGTTWTDYSTAIAINATTTVQAKAVKNGTESTTVSATYTIDLSKRPVYAYSESTGALTLTNAGIVTETNFTTALTTVTGTLLSVDLTSGTCNFSVAKLLNLIYLKLGGKVGSNFLLYVNEATNETVDDAADTYGTKNVVVKGSDKTYTAANFVITDKKPVSVPTAFTATAASYSRTGSNQWGTICLPFALASGNGIQYYELESVKNDKMTFKAVETVNANTPAVYSLSSGSGISIDDNNVSVPVTSSPTVNMGGCTLVGVQTEMVTLADGSSNYYIAENKFWQPTGTSVNIRPQRAYFQINSASGAKVFSIGVDDTVTAIDSISGNDGTTIVGIYSLNGMRQGSLQKGVNIVKFSDGTTRKVVIK